MMNNEQRTKFVRELMMRLPYGVMVKDYSGLEPRAFKPMGVNLTGGYLEWFDFANHSMRHSQFDDCKMVLKPMAWLLAEDGENGLFPFARYAKWKHFRKYGTECQWNVPFGKEMVSTHDDHGNHDSHFVVSLSGFYNGKLFDDFDYLQFLCENNVDFMGCCKQGFAVYEDGMENMPDLIEELSKKFGPSVEEVNDSYQKLT